MQTEFEYMYRDAGNFKVFGSLILDAEISPAAEALVRSRLESGEFFIAEQVGVPPLYEQLYESSGGPTSSDHCWHEFVGFRRLTSFRDGCSVLSTSEFIQNFAQVESWHGNLSSHFTIQTNEALAT